MTKHDPDVFAQTVEFIVGARNCATCRLLDSYVKWGADPEPGDDDTPWFSQECKLDNGPLWDSQRAEDHPYPPGATVCNLWEGTMLL